MNISIKGLFLSTLISVATVGCSSGPLQSGRLDNAEEYLSKAQAEANQPMVANESLGTANAFLATVLDNKFRLSKQELARLEALQKKSKEISRQINR